MTKRILVYLVLNSLIINLTLSQNTSDQFIEDAFEIEDMSCAYDYQNYRSELQEFENDYYQEMKNSDPEINNSNVLYTIPVVLHVVNNGEVVGSEANPDDATLIDILNETTERFRHIHAGAQTYSNPLYGVDTEIEFCLADADIFGNYTTGIVRHFEEIGYEIQNQYPTADYLNVQIRPNLTVCGSASPSGVRIKTDCIWSGLLCHEFGHFLSLGHTFSGTCSNSDCLLDGDKVCDTPPKIQSGLVGGTCDSPNNSCTTDEDDPSNNNPYRPVTLGGVGDQADMLENYMDYTASCWDSFTEGQKTRMRANITMNRMDMVNNSALRCTNNGLANYDAEIHNIIHTDDLCESIKSLDVLLYNNGNLALTSVDIVIKIENYSTDTISWTGNLLSKESTTVSLNPMQFPMGNLLLQSYPINPNNNDDDFPYNDFYAKGVFYLGGNSCNTFQSCENFNENTSSGPGNMTTVSFSGVFPTTSQNGFEFVRVCMAVEGDVSSSSEVFNIYDELNIKRGVTNNTSDCSGLGELLCFYIPVDEYEDMIIDNLIEFNLDPISSSIGLFCTSQVCADLFIPVGSSSLTGDCHDGIQNQDEMGVDCGGIHCIPCDCDEINYSVSDIIDEDYYLHVQNTIESDQIINSNLDVIFQAGQTIELNPNFETKISSNFDASINGCLTNQISDYDGNLYNTIQIKNQEWTTENLKTTHYRDGTQIQIEVGSWLDISSPAYCWLDNDVTNKDIYGALYNWYAVEDDKLCPQGWHVASENDWEILKANMGGLHAGASLKDTISLWNDPNAGATNRSGFSAVPGGIRSGNTFFSQGSTAQWWSKSENVALNTRAVSAATYSNSDNFVISSILSKTLGQAVRCVKGN